MKEALKKNRVVMMGIGVMLILSLTVVTTAYFTPKLIPNGNSNTVSGTVNPDRPNFTFNNKENGINLSNTYPMLESEGLATTGYTFSVKSNETTAAMKYEVVLETKSTNTLADSLVSFNIAGSTKVLTSVATRTPTVSEYNHGYLLASGTLNAGATASFTLKTWVNENGTVENAQNKSWEGKIVISATKVK